MERLDNHPFEEIAVGDRFVATHVLGVGDIERIALAASGFEAAAHETGLASANGFMDAATRLAWASLWLGGVVGARLSRRAACGPCSAKVETHARALRPASR